MIDEILETLKEINSKQELWDASATSYKKLYDVLINVGFTPDQAIAILINQGTGIGK